MMESVDRKKIEGNVDPTNMSGKEENSASISKIREELRAFNRDRDWEQFHSPKNLAISLSIEAAELLEHFQWSNDADTATTSEKADAIAEEMADVLLYLVQLADRLDIDILAAATEKLRINALKYPVEKSRGTNKKYTDL